LGTVLLEGHSPYFTSWSDAVILAAAASGGGSPDATTTALIALGGAVVGAAVSSATQVLVQWLQGRREAAARAREVKIAARVMQFDMARAWSNIEFSGRAKLWWPVPGLGPQVSDNDRRLVISALPTDGFDAFDSALYEIDRWYDLREGKQSNEPLTTSHDPRDLLKAATTISRAIAMLRDISGDVNAEFEPRLHDEPATSESSFPP